MSTERSTRRPRLDRRGFHRASLAALGLALFESAPAAAKDTSPAADLALAAEATAVDGVARIAIFLINHGQEAVEIVHKINGRLRSKPSLALELGPAMSYPLALLEGDPDRRAVISRVVRFEYLTLPPRQGSHARRVHFGTFEARLPEPLARGEREGTVTLAISFMPHTHRSRSAALLKILAPLALGQQEPHLQAVQQQGA